MSSFHMRVYREVRYCDSVGQSVLLIHSPMFDNVLGYKLAFPLSDLFAINDSATCLCMIRDFIDRKSTRLNSSHRL